MKSSQTNRPVRSPQKSNNRKTLIAIAIGGITLGATVSAAFAQESVFNGQPIRGAETVKEASLDTRLDAAFNQGLIDPLELANMRRDLDAIRVKEEAYRMENGGLAGSHRDKIDQRLARFSRDLDVREAQRGTAEASVIYIMQ